MKVVAYDSSRVTCLFPLEEAVPLSGVNDRAIVEGVKNKYSFLKGPDLSIDEVAKNGYKFDSGQFVLDSQIFRIAEFAIFRDGLVIAATKTDGSEAFLDDVIAFLQKEFSFRDLETTPRRYFQSQIVVEFERSPEGLLKSLDRLTAAISKPLKEIYEMEIRMRFARLDFDFDKEGTPTQVAAAVQRFVL
jgi:hypothetical protein